MPGEEAIPGTLMLAATPIGRPEDASARLTTALAATPVIAAEDTARLRRLADRLGVTLAGKVVSYYEGVEEERGPGLLRELRAGRDVLLVTDAGMPGVSDPGYRLTAALAVSGLPSDRFCFEGFPPRGRGDRGRRFAELASERRTMVFFESRRRLAATLRDLAAAFGPERPAVVCRELTKTHEEIRRGPLDELAVWAAGDPLGEITIVVAGASAPAFGPADVDAAVAEVSRRVAAGTSRRNAAEEVAAEAGLPWRVLYKAVLSPGVSS